MAKKIHIIGAGLAGSECAYQLLSRGFSVILHEMRPKYRTDAHHSGNFAELVCSNSFRSDEWQNNAVGLLHHELRLCGSLIMQAADAHSLPAGSALAVDRQLFSEFITKKLQNMPNLMINTDEISDIKQFGDDFVVIATGPLTSPKLSQAIQELTGMEHLAFFDAIAPIVHLESLDLSQGWLQSRWDKGEGKDYYNFAMNKIQYREFIAQLNNGEKTEFKEWEKNTPYFEGCLPIEVMAMRGVDTLRHGPMKPIGLNDPKEPERRPYAVMQLRMENKLGTLWNMVGFQTKLKHSEQLRIFRTIPGFEKAEFARLGGIHRNSFIKSPQLLSPNLALKTRPNIKFAGQITGVEGYVESTAIGLLAGYFIAKEIHQQETNYPSATTALGALLHHITMNADAKYFQPMNCNYGLFTPLAQAPAKHENKKIIMANRAVADLESWLKTQIK